MTVIDGRFDRRAVHRIFSEPVALDVVMDVDALAQAVELGGILAEAFVILALLGSLIILAVVVFSAYPNPVR